MSHIPRETPTAIVALATAASGLMLLGYMLGMAVAFVYNLGPVL